MPWTSSLFSILLALASFNGLLAFQNVILPKNIWHSSGSRGRISVTGARMTATARAYRDEKPSHFLLEEFCTHSGEVVNPYAVLKVSRDAERSEIRHAYITLSRRYHPDGVRHRDILPGKW